MAMDMRTPDLKIMILYSVVLSLLATTSMLSAAECITGGTNFSVKNQLIENAKSALVQIKSDFDENTYQTGTGFLVGDEGYLLTNFHVIQGAKSITIFHHKSKKAKEYEEERIRVIAIDPVKDLAILKINNIKFSDRIKSLNIESCYEDVTGNPDLIIVANSGDIRNFVTRGIIGNVDYISTIVRDRPEVKENDIDIYDYNILRFRSVIARGNSGAPMFNAENGKIIGIATGASGDREYAAFGVPIKYARELLSKNLGKQGDLISVLSDKNFVNLRTDDPYYRRVKKYSSVSYQNMISISGNVVEKFSQGILNNANVIIYDKNDTKMSFSQVTDTDGSFGFTIPKSPDIQWAMKVEHNNYQDVNTAGKDFGIIEFDKSGLKHEMVIKKEYSKEATWFYAVPQYVNLKHKTKLISIKYEYTKWGVPRREAKMTKWSLCEFNDVCNFTHKWLKVNKSKGEVTNRGGKLQVKYEGSDSDYTAFDDLVIYAQGENSKISAPVYIFADQDESDVHIQGYVTLNIGGIPKQHDVVITAKAVNDGSGQESSIPIDIDNLGYFEFDRKVIDASPDQKLQLEVVSGQYEDVHKSKHVIDLLNPPSKPIIFELKLK